MKNTIDPTQYWYKSIYINLPNVRNEDELSIGNSVSEFAEAITEGWDTLWDSWQEFKRNTNREYEKPSFNFQFFPYGNDSDSVELIFNGRSNIIATELEKAERDTSKILSESSVTVRKLLTQKLLTTLRSEIETEVREEYEQKFDKARKALL